MAVDRASPAAQIANELRAQIDAGKFEPGKPLPSDAELANRFGVSKPTVSKARAMLVALGLVESRAGAASIVRDVSRDAVPGRNRIERARRTGRIYPEGHYARVLQASLVPANSDVAAALNVPLGTPTIQRHRITFAPDETPLSKSTTYFPRDLADRCPALLQTERIAQGTTLYIEEQTGRAARSIASSVWCRAGGNGDGDGNDAAQLQLAPDTCLLAVATTTYDEAGHALAHEVELHPPGTSIALEIADV